MICICLKLIEVHCFKTRPFYSNTQSVKSNLANFSEIMVSKKSANLILQKNIRERRVFKRFTYDFGSVSF